MTQHVCCAVQRKPYRQTLAIGDPEGIRESLEHHVDLIIDGGLVTNSASTVLDWHDKNLTVVRHGAGDIGFLEE